MKIANKIIQLKAQLVGLAVPLDFQMGCFMINFLDDYHNIHTKKCPTDLKKTTVVHMASAMVDIQLQIPAVKRGSTIPHRSVQISINGVKKHVLVELMRML